MGPKHSNVRGHRLYIQFVYTQVYEMTGIHVKSSGHKHANEVTLRQISVRGYSHVDDV